MVVLQKYRIPIASASCGTLINRSANYRPVVGRRSPSPSEAHSLSHDSMDRCHGVMRHPSASPGTKRESEPESDGVESGGWAGVMSRLRAYFNAEVPATV